MTEPNKDAEAQLDFNQPTEVVFNRVTDDLKARIKQTASRASFCMALASIALLLTFGAVLWLPHLAKSIVGPGLLSQIKYTPSTPAEVPEGYDSVTHEKTDAIVYQNDVTIDMRNLFYVVPAICALGLVVFGMFMAAYRYHSQEESKAYALRVAFIRTKIAAIARHPRLDDDVKAALLSDTFSFISQPENKGKRTIERIESPLPGHVGSDMSVIVLNKLLELAEVQGESKKNGVEDSTGTD